MNTVNVILTVWQRLGAWLVPWWTELYWWRGTSQYNCPQSRKYSQTHSSAPSWTQSTCKHVMVIVVRDIQHSCNKCVHPFFIHVSTGIWGSAIQCLRPLPDLSRLGKFFPCAKFSQFENQWNLRPNCSFPHLPYRPIFDSSKEPCYTIMKWC